MGTKVTRVLIAKPGLDGHDRGAKVVATALRDAGMEVIYTGLRQSTEKIVATVVEEDVDVIGLSILSGTHISLTKKLMQKLKEAGVQEDVLVVVGGNIPHKDEETLIKMGVDRVFTTGSKLTDITKYFQNTLGKVG